MTKPREKTREELTAEIEDRKKKIRQFENREKMLRQKLSVEERKARNHRLCKRGGHVAACIRRLFFLPVPTYLEPSIDGDRIKYSPTSANVREKP